MRSFFREIVITTVLALGIFFLIQATLGSFIIVGISMEPSFYDGQRLLVNRVVYHLHEPERGDVIVFQPGESQQPDYIKRIIALPGDMVEVKNGAVYVNDSKLDEPYIKSSPRYSTKPKTIPANSYFVLGDNRNNSNDSHNGWVVPSQKIVGKVWLLIWPPNEWGIVPEYSLAEQLVSYVNN
jgi:signal peptidase I